MTVGRDIHTDPEVMGRIKVITDIEDGLYSVIPGWNNAYMATSPKALLLHFPQKGWRESEVWFPLSQLRKSADGSMVYASNWFLKERGISA